MKNRSLSPLALLLAVHGAFAQSGPVADPNRAEVVERAHRPLLVPPSSRAKDLSRVTAEVRGPAEQRPQTVKLARRNYIDEHIFGRMAQDRIPHAGLATDGEFVRRAFLDATGRAPSPDDVLSFTASKDPLKHDRLVDRLVDSDDFAGRWTYYFEDLFRAGSMMGSGLNLFHYWLHENLRIDRPYNEIVTELLTGGGKTSFSTPGSQYFGRDVIKAKDDPEAPDAQDLINIQDTVDEFTITYSKIFLGVNLACISCHDGAEHLEKVNLYLTAKTREQFFQQAAFHGNTRQIMNWENGYQANTEYTVDDAGSGYDTKSKSMIRVPRTGGEGVARFILSGEKPRPGQNLRDELARLVTGDQQFARAFTNRIWAEFMGVGIVDPVDEFDLLRCDPKNPPPAPWTLQPSNPQLLEAMATDFRRHGYSFKHFVKTIMKSNAYRLSSRFEGEWKEAYAPYYARKFVRMLSAVELHDLVALATGVTSAEAGSGPKTVMGMPDPKKAGATAVSFMKVFGQGSREALPKKIPPSALQAMFLMQSAIVTEGVRANSKTRVGQLLKRYPDDAILIDNIYLVTLSRRPNPRERSIAVESLRADRQRGAENLQWALINSPEFLFSY